MNELIYISNRDARKAHRCSLCGGTIQPGETYVFCVNKYDGEIGSFKEHAKCNEIANEIADFVDADDGITEEEFMDGVNDILHDFICPDCEYFDSIEDPWCEECKEVHKCNTIDMVYDFLQKYELYRAYHENRYFGWMARGRTHE